MKFSGKKFPEFSSCNYYLSHFHKVESLAGSLNLKYLNDTSNVHAGY